MALKAAAKTTVQPPTTGINFGEDTIYVGGGGLPEGDYALEFTIQNYQATNRTTGQSVGQSRLGVMVYAHSLADPTAEARTQFYSFGSNADKSFAPDAETGKRLVPIPGAVGQTLNDQTNWNIFRKSLYDCGLPQGIFTNDLSVLDGIHVHMTNVPEPESRKGFATSKTGEMAEEPRKNQTIPIVTEIKEDGKPWEGKGGLPTAAPAAPKVAPAKTTGPKAIAAPAPAAAEVDSDDIKIAALNGVTAVLTQKGNESGMLRLKLRASTFSAIKAAAGEDMAQAVTDTFFGSDDQLNPLLNELGYEVKGQTIQPRA